MASHIFREMKRQKMYPQPVRPWKLSYWMPKDAYWPRFVPQGKTIKAARCYHRRSKSVVGHCPTNVHPATRQRTNPHSSSVRREDLEERLWSSPTSILQSWPSSPWTSMFAFVQHLMRGQHYATNKIVQKAVRLFTTRRNGVLPLRDLQSPSTVANLHRSGWGFCRDEYRAQTCWHVVFFPLHTFTLLWNNFFYMVKGPAADAADAPQH
jgi:hypothetical protein